ncbi:hypothetical protein ACFCX4_08145 [Kitasatospora sp. NPDC056327]|uniref:hypothetical protein n=1 Tax=Kitasatospora sp. NPDC056327 TaxID=3345785 RepID=UPI0035DE2BD7
MRGRAVAGARLCPLCRRRLVDGLTRLPRLYHDCALLLVGADRPRDRVSGGALPGMPFNTAVAEVRSLILGMLRAWSGLVVGQRFCAAPRGTAAGTAEFLLRHAGWLAAHEAAGELSREVALAERRARRVIDPDRRSRVRVGACREADCAGTLTAEVPADRPRRAVEVACDADPAHRWSAQEWMWSGQAAPTGRPAQSGAQSGQAAVQWLGVQDVALLWGIAAGSVYRYASQHGWRRRTDGGRVSYCAADVRRSLGARRGGG